MGNKRTFAEQQDTSPNQRNPAKSPQGRKADPAGTSSEAPARTAADSREHLLKVATEFNRVLDECLEAPKVEPVHQLRTGSRRVQAMVESICREAGRGRNTIGKPAKKWLRQLKALRRAAGPVRDMDVHRNLLEKNLQRFAATEMVESAGPVVSKSAGESDPVLDQLAPQARKLDAWLKQQRDAQAAVLEKQIKKRRETLSARQRDFLDALEQASSARKTRRNASMVALEDFVRVVDAMPRLDAANLHDFRKRTKKARYVAESAGEGENAQMIAKALKRVQDAIGDWHDWQCLTEEAATALKQDGFDLTAWLKSRADRSLLDALNITERTSGPLLGEWMAGKQRPPVKNLVGKAPSRAIDAQGGDQPQTVASDVA
jgi:CHAD domain-containing protein